MVVSCQDSDGNEIADQKPCMAAEISIFSLRAMHNMHTRSTSLLKVYYSTSMFTHLNLVSNHLNQITGALF